MVTIFTPVYNRSKTIGCLYKSLLRQTDKCFEWIVVDDGSTDDTFMVLKEFKDNTDLFPIRLYKITNHGKHFAINLGVREAKSEAFFIVDSDDYLTDDAVEFINKAFYKALEDKLAGISGLRSGTELKERPLFEGYVDASNFEREKYGLSGDKAEVYSTSILKKYPFPYFEGENFLTEEVVWNRIAASGYRLRWFNRVTYHCEYRADGLSAKGIKLFFDNPLGWGLWLKESISYGKWNREKINYNRWLFFEHESLNRSMQEICEILDITKDEYLFFKKVFNENIRRITQFFKKDTDLALYGNGAIGIRMSNYLRICGLNIKYIIDRRSRAAGLYPVYLPEDDISPVDVILFSLNDKDPEIRALMHNKLPFAKLTELDDIGINLFN